MTSTRPRTTPPPAERHYRFVGGKGGVGKTTCAAALAMARAAIGRRVLLVSTDPAHSLGDVLGRRLGATPRRVSLRRGSLHAVELDADAALTRFIDARRPQLRRIFSRGTYLDDEDIDRLLRLVLPGVDELIGLVELERLAGSRAYDDVIVDTAPTGHTLRLLATPATLARIATVLDDMQAKHRFLAESLGGRYRPDTTDALVDEIGADAQRLDALLRHPARCAFSWVLLPEVLALEEARDGVAALEGAGMSVTEAIVNRVTPPPVGPCSLCQGRVAAEAAVIAQARETLGARVLRLLPALPAEPRGTIVLRSLGRCLLRPLPRVERRRSGVRPRGRRPALPRATRESDAWLTAVLPAGVRLVLVAGKGGVGKTTCAAAVAQALATRRPAQRVLLLSVDPAHSVGDVLGTEIGDAPTPIKGAPSGLRAREVDAPRLFAERRGRYLAAVDEVFAALRGGSHLDPSFDRVVVEELIDLAPPGVDELFGILTVVEALAASGGPPRYDTVVLDTAPTGHAIRLLEMPETGLAWVHAFMAILLKYRKVIGLGEIGGDLVELSRDLRELLALLHDAARTRVVAVTRPAELPRRETARLVAEVGRLGIRVAGVIVNARTPPGCARCRRADRAEARVVGALRRDIDQLTRRGAALVEAPAVAPPPRGVHYLARWRRTWRETDA